MYNIFSLPAGNLDPKNRSRSLWPSGYRVRVRYEDPGSNLTADGCAYRDGYCDMHPWARAGCPYAAPRSTQPCIASGSLNRVPASAGVKAGMLPLPGGR